MVVIQEKTRKRLELEAARQPYPLLFVTVSGAHSYGFPSPDSDYDLRGVHVLPVNEVIGLRVYPNNPSIRPNLSGVTCLLRIN